MNNTLIVFEKDYSGESLYDMSRDIHEAFEEDFNPVVAELPVDDYGLHKGTFKITIEWVNE